MVGQPKSHNVISLQDYELESLWRSRTENYRHSAFSPFIDRDIEEFYNELSVTATFLDPVMTSTTVPRIRKALSVLADHEKIPPLTMTRSREDLIRRRDITLLDCLNYNPEKNIEIICTIAILVNLFSIVISIAIGIHIIHPLFATLSAISFAGFWVMAKVVRQRRRK